MNTALETTARAALTTALDRLVNARTLTRPQAEAVHTEFDTELTTALAGRPTDVAEPAYPGGPAPSNPPPTGTIPRPKTGVDGDEHSWSSTLGEVGGYV